MLLLLATASTSSSSSLVTDFRALLDLKKGIEPSGGVLGGWNSTEPWSDCSSWERVRCLKNRVVSLDLSDMNLNGNVSSAAISALDRLTHLSLAGNNFTGEIVIENLTQLRFVNISNNQFQGSLESWNYASLPNVEVLDAYNNNLNGRLPLGIATLKHLTRLDLGGNYHSGNIPESYGKMSGLEYLSLAGNDLTGKIPRELGNLTNLRELYMGYYNAFQGGIPAEFGRLIKLVHLDLSSCELDGVIPVELGNLNLLGILYLHINQLSGTIPRELGNLTEVVQVDLSHNALTGEIPSEFSKMKKLEGFSVFMNKLHGPIPDFFAELHNLNHLLLWMNNLTGEIPERLGRNSKLREVDLSSNKLTGRIREDLCAMKQLQTLILFNNFLFGAIPESLGYCPSLIRVRLGQNFLNGSIPPGLVYSSRLSLLELQNNALSGNLPENGNQSSSPVSLEELNLSNNLLSGVLPRSISDLFSIQNLLMAGNSFSGPIPRSIGALRQILKLDLSRNFLTGEIPREIGSCSHLTVLDLSHNNLSGAIPSEISKIRNLNYLNLSRNHLNQSIPGSIGSMKSLTTADFSYNNLSGQVLESGQFAFFNASSFTGNLQLCGRPLNISCNVPADRSKKAPKDFKLIFALGLLLCSLIFGSAAIIKAKSLKRNKKGPGSWKMTAFQKLDFVLADVLECVKDGNVIGEGGAGIVYHGKSQCGAEIAVKKLLGIGHDRGFRAEIETLGSIRHRNIVRLLGFCTNNDTNLLIYDYMRNGSLGEALHGKKGGMALGWDLRYRIAMDAGRGLCYLHHDCSPLIVHRDVKSNNILLDSSFEAHVADFGLAKFLHRGGAVASQSMSAVAGSYGYIAPEYAYTLSVDEKSDVYSYGVVLLELITGRRPVGSFGEGVDIVHWSRKTTDCRKDRVDRILDPRLAAAPQDEAMHLFFVAMLCVQEDSVERPTMREVVQMLSEFRCRAPETQLPNPPAAGPG